MRSGWPHTQADHGSVPADRRRGPFGPDVSWPTGYSGLEYRDGAYRYPASAAPQLPAAQGQHPYAAFSAAGYGDDGYRDPGYDGPAAQDAGYQQPGYAPAAPSANGYGEPRYAGPGYGGAGEIELAYPPAPESRWQAWDYDQPLRYEGEDEPAHPAQDSYGQTDGYRQPAGYDQRDDYRNADGYGPGGYQAAPVYDNADYNGSGYSRPGSDDRGYNPADYNGSGYSRPGIDGPGYDLSGIIGTGDFEAFGYDEPSYDRLSYDDPRYYDAPRDGGSGYDGGRYDAPRGGGDGHRGGPDGGPRLDETRMDLAELRGSRSDETWFDGPRFDETRLDRLWLSDEDLRHDDPVGYENDGFGGDSRVRSGYPDFDAFHSSRSDETRLDLGVGPRTDQTRFDVPVYDETRIDNMRALASRPSATGLLAPPDDRPQRWAEETSFDDFGDLDELDDEPVRAPAAFVRTAERHDDTATRRAVGRRRGRSGDRRQWMALGAIAVVAAGAIGGVLMKYVFSGPSGPAHTVVAPNEVDGFTRMPNLEKQMKVDSLAQSVMQQSSGQVSDLVPAVYQQGNASSGANAQIFMFVGGKLAGASPSASVASFVQDYPGAKVVPAGSLGGDAVCAERQLNGEGVAMCVWFDNDTFGALVSPTMTTAKLATTLDEVRPGLELYANK
jgi:hypothetical protein